MNNNALVELGAVCAQCHIPFEHSHGHQVMCMKCYSEQGETKEDCIPCATYDVAFDLIDRDDDYYNDLADEDDGV